MSTLLEEPTTSNYTPAQRLRTTMAAVRLSIQWLGVRKTLSPHQKAQAADAFGAEGEYLSAAKKLLDTGHPAFKAVTAIKTMAVNYWRGLTLPYPEAGIRLIRQADIATFDMRMGEVQSELDSAVEKLDEHFAELKSAARERLGRLYNSADYPESLTGLFRIGHDFPSVEPPDYLRQLSPEIYRHECQQMQARFDEAIQLAEQAFLEELGNLVSHLTERLVGKEDGKPKVFRDSAVNNLNDFFERFRRLNVRSNEQLEDLVEQCRQVVGGVAPQSLRDNHVLRQSVATELGKVGQILDGLLVDRPRRNILRRVK